jgi:winged helix DNA-binding protein
VRGRTLTLRELNRATLARQLLLERRKLSPPAAIERLVGMQAQWPPAPYVGLWTRLEGFRRETLERAVRRGDVLKPTVMRGTLHLVTARDYPIFYAAFREMPTWFKREHLEHALRIAPEVSELARKNPLTQKAALEHLEREHGHTDHYGRRVFHALRRHAHLLHAPETALWTTRPQAVYHPYDEPEPVDVLAARTEIVRRYLAAFGPSTRADLADWSGLRVSDVAPAIEALEPLRRFRDERGRELLDLPRAPLPPADTPAPVRFLPKWDNVLLGFADRKRVISDEIRKQVVGKNGDVAQTVLVDGLVAATWSADPKGKVTVNPFAPLPRVWRREVEEEKARLEAWLR